MAGVVWSQRIASAMRRVIKGRTGGHAGEVSSIGTPATGSRWQVDLNKDEPTCKAPQKVADTRVAGKADAISARIPFEAWPHRCLRDGGAARWRDAGQEPTRG